MKTKSRIAFEKQFPFPKCIKCPSRGFANGWYCLSELEYAKIRKFKGMKKCPKGVRRGNIKGN